MDKAGEAARGHALYLLSLVFPPPPPPAPGEDGVLRVVEPRAGHSFKGLNIKEDSTWLFLPVPFHVDFEMRNIVILLFFKSGRVIPYK